MFDFIRFSKDKNKLRKLVTEDAAYAFLEEDAYDMVACYAGEKEMFRIKEKHKKGGKVNMCQGLKEWLEEERSEGKREGKAEMLVESVETVMVKFQLDLSQACERIGRTEEEYYHAKELTHKSGNRVS